MFPKIDVRVLTLELNFFIPLWRDALLWMGFLGCGNGSCTTILSQKSKLAKIGTKCSRCRQHIRQIGRYNLLTSPSSTQSTQQEQIDSCAAFLGEEIQQLSSEVATTYLKQRNLPSPRPDPLNNRNNEEIPFFNFDATEKSAKTVKGVSNTAAAAHCPCESPTSILVRVENAASNSFVTRWW